LLFGPGTTFGVLSVFIFLNFMRLSPYAALVLLAAGCSSDNASSTAPENQLMFSDFESLAGWASDAPSLTREKAHSGKYAIKVDNDIEYSLTYRNQLGNLSPTKLQKLRLTAYAYLTNPQSPVALTLQVVKSAQDGAGIFVQGIELGKEVKAANEWTKVSQVITLPQDVTAVNELRVYLWRAGATEPVYVDDVELSIEK
jgi:hypothetical protein